MSGDPRLDALPEFDERSRAFPIAALTGVVPLRTRSWRISARLDQGREGACVGFGWAHELNCSPVNVPVDTALARNIYREAQRIDEWPGEDYDGTSVLAGAKVVRARGFMREYRWTFGIDDLLHALVDQGPVVVATNWHDGMYDPRPSKLLDVSGPVVGRHCYLVRGLILKPWLRGERRLPPLLRVWNSWSWNEAFVKVEDMEKLLLSGGEGCVPVGRQAA